MNNKPYLQRIRNVAPDSHFHTIVVIMIVMILILLVSLVVFNFIDDESKEEIFYDVDTESRSVIVLPEVDRISLPVAELDIISVKLCYNVTENGCVENYNGVYRKGDELHLYIEVTGTGYRSIGDRYEVDIKQSIETIGPYGLVGDLTGDDVVVVDDQFDEPTGYEIFTMHNFDVIPRDFADGTYSATITVVDDYYGQLDSELKQFIVSG